MSSTLPASELVPAANRAAPSPSVLVIDERANLVGKIHDLLRQGDPQFEVQGSDTLGSEALGIDRPASAVVDEFLARAEPPAEQSQLGAQTVVCSPLRLVRRTRLPDVAFAKSVIQKARQLSVRRCVLISSAEVYGAEYSNSGLLQEKESVTRKRPNAMAECWSEIEEFAQQAFADGAGELVILRPCWTLLPDQADLPSRWFASRFAFPAVGFDPSLQLLSLDDLAGAIVAAITSEQTGIYNVAPDQVIPIRAALRMARAWTIPIPYTIRRWLWPARSRQQLDFIRYSWTVSSEKLRDELGFQPRQSSADALAEFACRAAGTPPSRAADQDDKSPSFDRFGMDAGYIRSCGRWQLGFMDKVYWRMEVDGVEHVPTQGGGVLAGPHRGFMPFDGVMIVHLLCQRLSRIPRFLMHPALVKFPLLATFLTRLGGIIATQENADRVLGQDELVGVFPEGIRGAFRMYERGETYQLGKFRDDYVKFALRHGVPIIPFVTVGPAETFPILAKIEWPWWKRLTHWPFFPITATWPLVPAPLPVKWHIKFLEPIPTSEYGPDAALDRKVVSQLSRDIRDRMQQAIDQMRSHRKSMLHGSIFRQIAANAENVRTPETAHSSRVGETMDVA